MGQQRNEEQNTSSTEHTQSSKSTHVAGKFCFTTLNSVKWILDSGATDHMCFDDTLFESIEIFNGVENAITIPNGKKVKVTHLGTICLNEHIILKNVLYVPDFRYNLIFIPKLCKYLSCHAVFTNDECYIQGSSMRPLLLGKLKHGLYCLDDTVL